MSPPRQIHPVRQPVPEDKLDISGEFQEDLTKEGIGASGTADRPPRTITTRKRRSTKTALFTIAILASGILAN